VMTVRERDGDGLCLAEASANQGRTEWRERPVEIEKVVLVPDEGRVDLGRVKP